MMKTPINKLTLAALISATMILQTHAQGTAFTYQGQLEFGGGPINGNYDLTFSLWDDPFGAGQVGPTLTNLNLSITNGLVHVTLDYGASVFSGAGRWLEIGVRTNGGGVFSLLSPRQPLTGTPYAIKALEAIGVPTGTITSVMLADDSVSSVKLGPDVGVWSTSGADISYAGGDVGIGTTSPTTKLDVVGTVTASAFAGDGSGLTGIPDGHSLDAADGSPVNALFVDNSGQVGIGTTSPAADLHVRGSGSTGELTVTPDSSDSQSQLFLAENSSATLGMILRNAGNESSNPLHFIGQNSGSETDPLLSIERNTGDVGIGTGTSGIDARLHVQNSGRVAKFDLFGADGEIVAWAKNDSIVGNVTVAAGVVSYNAFTGSHYAWSKTEPLPATLMTLTGQNRPLNADGAGEIVYGVEVSHQPNDPASLGAFVATTTVGEHDQAMDVRLVSAVGNGELWVVHTGRDIRPGDLLISSDISGCVMLDDSSRFPVGHIVARAAQPVRWSEVQVGADGNRRTKLSVLFDPFTRGLLPSSELAEVRELSERLEQRDSEIAEMKEQNARLEQRLEAIERLLTQPKLTQMAVSGQRSR